MLSNNFVPALHTVADLAILAAHQTDFNDCMSECKGAILTQRTSTNYKQLSQEQCNTLCTVNP